MSEASLLTRTLKAPMVGDDIYGVKRTVYRLLDAGDHKQRLKALEKQPLAMRRTFGAPPGFASRVREARIMLGFAPAYFVDQAFWRALAKGGWPDAKAVMLMSRYIEAHPKENLVFPVPMGEYGNVCQYLHETGGKPGNWAIDVCTTANTTIVAVEAGKVTRLSGRPPSQDTNDPSGTYGWSIYFETPAGYEYYVTHLGKQLVTVGNKLEVGDTIGRVGDQAYRPDHTHYGVTSPHGEADAKKRILAVSRAPRID